MGLAALIGAIFSLIQYPLFVVMETWCGGRTIGVGIHIYSRWGGGAFLGGKGGFHIYGRDGTFTIPRSKISKTANCNNHRII